MFVRSNTSWILSLGTKTKHYPPHRKGAHFLAYGAPKSSWPSNNSANLEGSRSRGIGSRKGADRATRWQVASSARAAHWVSLTVLRLLAFAALELGAALAAGLLDDELDATVLAPAVLVVL